MTIPNLPAGIPREASEYFSKTLVEKILPDIIKNKNSEILNKARILDKGKFGNYFKYLNSFVNK